MAPDQRSGHDEHRARNSEWLQQCIRSDERQIAPATEAAQRSRSARRICEAMQDAEAMRERQQHEDRKQRRDLEPRVWAISEGTVHSA